jgi:hypothetical protein
MRWTSGHHGGSHGTDSHHCFNRVRRRVPDLLHEGRIRGGFSIIGIPLLSFVMDPVTGGLLAPLFIAMDLFALRYWKPSTRSSRT